MGSRVSFLKKLGNSRSTASIDGVMIPLVSVSEAGGESLVQVIDGSKIKLMSVEVAEETSNYARVTEGLSSGMKVVARFDSELSNNQKVIIK